MTPSTSTTLNERTDSADCTKTLTVLDVLHFTPITDADLPLINGLLQAAISRTCDYSIGGIFMWIDYFKYEYCVAYDTLFIKGRTETQRNEVAFMVPVGALALDQSVDLIRIYCERRGLRPVFSAVPDDRLEALVDVLGTDADVEPIDDWADYLYDIHSLATLKGKSLSKKRNHVNQFFAANPDWQFESLTYDLLPEATMFFYGNHTGDKTDEASAAMAQYEHDECARVLANYASYPFEGAVLRGQTGEIVAMAIGEVIGDTLFVHIEKMNHEVPGAGAAINKMFSEYMLMRHPALRYANREEDCGDLGLRNAKLQYKPVALLHKYNVRA